MKQQETVMLSDSERKIMELLWREGETSARQVAEAMERANGWNVNATYTLIKRCIRKGAIERREPGFLCRPLVSWDSVRQAETEKLLDRVFNGSVDLLFSALVGSGRLSKPELERLRQRLEELESEEN